ARCGCAPAGRTAAASRSTAIWSRRSRCWERDWRRPPCPTSPPSCAPRSAPRAPTWRSTRADPAYHPGAAGRRRLPLAPRSGGRADVQERECVLSLAGVEPQQRRVRVIGLRLRRVLFGDMEAGDPRGAPLPHPDAEGAALLGRRVDDVVGGVRSDHEHPLGALGGGEGDVHRVLQRLVLEVLLILSGTVRARLRGDRPGRPARLEIDECPALIWGGRRAPRHPLGALGGGDGDVHRVLPRLVPEALLILSGTVRARLRGDRPGRPARLEIDECPALIDLEPGRAAWAVTSEAS